MKSYKTTVFFIALFALLTWGGLLQAQYDDIYYDPDTDGEYYDYSSSSNTNSGDTYAYADDNGRYDDESYDHFEDDYDYYYTSRIRRFHRPYQGFGYFDPVYVDRYYYDPFFNPFTTVLIYDNFYSFNRWNRWNRWNRYNYWNRYDPWYQPGFGWNSWGPRNSVFISYNNFGFGNNFYGGGFYGNGFNGGGIFGGGYSNYYCPPSWGSGFTYNTASVNNDTYYGPRTGGSTRTSGNSRRDFTPSREPAKDVTGNPAVVSRNGNDKEIVNTTGTTTRQGTQTRAIEDNRTTRARTYDRNNVRETTVTAPRYERSPSSTTLDRNTNTRQSAPRTYDRNTNTRQSAPRTYDRNTNTRQSAPRTYNRNTNTRQSAPRTIDRSRSNSSRSSGSYSPSSRSNSSRSSGSFSPSSRSNSSRSSGSFSPSSSGSSTRSMSSGSSRSSSSSRSSGGSTKSSSSSRRGGN